MSQNKDTIKIKPGLKYALQKMRDGWGLAKSTSYLTSSSKVRVWIQEGGIGKGGKSETLRKHTIGALLLLDLVKVGETAPYGTNVTEYILTERGKTINLEGGAK